MAVRPESFRTVIGWWPSKGEMASDVGVSLDAVRKWWQRDSIPSDRWKSVLETPVARAKGLRADTLADLASLSLDEAGR